LLAAQEQGVSDVSRRFMTSASGDVMDGGVGILIDGSAGDARSG